MSEQTYFLCAIANPGEKQTWICDYCGRHRDEHGPDRRCPAPTPEAADTAPASDFDRLPWPEIVELIGGRIQRIQPGEVHFYWHGRDLIAANNGGEYNLMEVTRALDYSLPFGGERYNGPTDAITLAERLAEALTPAPASPGEAAAAQVQYRWRQLAENLLISAIRIAKSKDPKWYKNSDEKIAAIMALAEKWDEEARVLAKTLRQSRPSAATTPHVNRGRGEIPGVGAAPGEASDLREAVAALAHEQWSGWMEYLFSKCVTNLEPGCMILPRWAVDRWQRQMKTPYPDLSDAEKDSDRAEADRVLALVRAQAPKDTAKHFRAGYEVGYDEAMDKHVHGLSTQGLEKQTELYLYTLRAAVRGEKEGEGHGKE